MNSQKTPIVSKRGLLYISGFIFAFHIALPSYIFSSFLGDSVNPSAVGSIYAFASFMTIICHFLTPKWLRKIGNFQTIMAVLSVEMLTLLGMAYFSSPIFIVLFFIINFSAIAIASFNFDIFLEKLSANEQTGSIRGTYLTSANIAWVIAPISAGFILAGDKYFNVFLISSLLVIPLLTILKYGFEKFADGNYETIPVIGTLKRIIDSKDIRKIFSVSFLLQFFYSWMVIYTPIHLYKNIGFSWEEIGLMFSIMLLPFVLIELPLGKIADKLFGEKEMLSLGFVFIAISTGLIYFLDSGNFWLWAIVLFMTRVGASIVEIMSETYFFKIIDSKDMHTISMFRVMRPLAYIVGPLTATALLSIFDFRFLFLLLGLIMLYGLRFSLTLKDTK
jgi:MFS family permease